MRIIFWVSKNHGFLAKTWPIHLLFATIPIIADDINALSFVGWLPFFLCSNPYVCQWYHHVCCLNLCFCWRNHDVRFNAYIRSFCWSNYHFSGSNNLKIDCYISIPDRLSHHVWWFSPYLFMVNPWLTPIYGELPWSASRARHIWNSALVKPRKPWRAQKPRSRRPRESRFFWGEEPWMFLDFSLENQPSEWPDDKFQKTFWPEQLKKGTDHPWVFPKVRDSIWLSTKLI